MTVGPEPIVVTLDGQPCPQYTPQGQKQWDYNASRNSIAFEPVRTPAPDTEIKIQYAVACE